MKTLNCWLTSYTFSFHSAGSAAFFSVEFWILKNECLVFNVDNVPLSTMRFSNAVVIHRLRNFGVPKKFRCDSLFFRLLHFSLICFVVISAFLPHFPNGIQFRVCEWVCVRCAWNCICPWSIAVFKPEKQLTKLRYLIASNLHENPQQQKEVFSYDGRGWLRNETWSKSCINNNSSRLQSSRNIWNIYIFCRPNKWNSQSRWHGKSGNNHSRAMAFFVVSCFRVFFFRVRISHKMH